MCSESFTSQMRKERCRMAEARPCGFQGGSSTFPVMLLKGISGAPKFPGWRSQHPSCVIQFLSSSSDKRTIVEVSICAST